MKKILKKIYLLFFVDWLSSIFAFSAKTGIGTDKCLKKGFLPVPIHFYSPIPDLADLQKNKIWDKKSKLAGIDFNSKNQLKLLKNIGRKFGKECLWPLNKTSNLAQYYADNDTFGYGCAAAAHLVIREFKPKNLMEIGSGQSSKVISASLQKNQDSDAIKSNYLIIDPYPPNYVAKRKIKYSRVIKKKVELLEPSFFDQLGKNDILFIDSSHSVKIGGDVNFLYLEVLPRLKPGVIVHVHDINLPYEYSKIYATNEAFRQFWTEQYLLQSFLCFNKEYEVLLAMNFLMRDYAAKFQRALPNYNPKVHKYISGSFWLRRK